MTVSCAVGHYCPSGTVSSTSNPCPAGTFTNSANLVNSGQCTQCPRVIPVVLAQLLRLGQIVLLVEFVLVGQALVVTMCPAGTYSSLTTLADTSNAPRALRARIVVVAPPQSVVLAKPDTIAQ